MSEYRILKDGELIEADLMTWAMWFEDIDSRRVAYTDLGDCFVSTVCLGVDRAFDDGEPLWFETMVRGGDLDGEIDQYATLEAAMWGHEQMVDRVRNGSQH